MINVQSDDYINYPTGISSNYYKLVQGNNILNMNKLHMGCEFNFIMNNLRLNHMLNGLNIDLWKH